ncbi:MAG TPA: hypothetical protein VN253_19150, partial [Kofleriaceae bacterium]|nr:hypothetical protein [Kofleriaceae bacterium]
LATGPLEGQTVARTVVNPTQQGFSPTEATAAASPGHKIHGRYVIQLSDELDASHVKRAIAHEVAELRALRDLAGHHEHPRPDALRPGATRAALSPHDRGRLAEIEVLAAQLASPTATADAKAHARTELAALVEHLGLREGEPGAAARFELAAAHLGERARAELARTRGATADGTAAHAELSAIRTRASEDIAAAERDRMPRSDHDMPRTTDEHGRPLDGAALRERAQQAADARQRKSDATWAELEALHRAGAARGEIPRLPFELQIGGGASLAGRDRAHLVVDDRGRWHADGNHEIAQTTTQTRQARDAGLGDPTEVAGPNARVPRDAVTYWEDHIAAQGPVVNGRASLRIGDRGELLVDILYRGRTLTFRTEKVPYVATGFVPELVPGGPRDLSPTVAAARVAEVLDKAAQDAPPGSTLQTAAARAHAALARTPMVSPQDAIQLLTILGDPELRAALRSSPEIAAALELGGAAEHWRELTAGDDPARPHVFFGDQANLGREQAMRSHNWVIAGTGGTAVSAAEIILSQNLKARVTLIGPNEPAGLLENDQFRALAAERGDAALAAALGQPPGDGRLSIRRDYAGTPVGKDRGAWEASRSSNERDGWVDERDISAELRSRRVYDVNGAQTHVHGTAYIAAVGRADAYPPVVASLIDQTRRSEGRYYVKALFHDRQYAGYQVTIKSRDGQTVGTVDVTGAASRFLPIDDAIAHAANREDAKDLKKVKAAEDWDAPPESGNFAGGFAATATQAARYAAQRKVPPRAPVETRNEHQ